MLRLFLLVGVLGAVAARRSPNSELFEDLLVSTTRTGTSRDVAEDTQLDVPGLIAKYGYPIEVHNVVTSDGYILEVHRIPYGRKGVNTGIPVLVMHGLLSSSADFVVTGPENALAYILADAGYDVWLGNARGNFYSRKHQRLNPDSNKDFWRFSWDQIGNLDLSAIVDHITSTSGRDKLHYIGHSQGGTSFLVLNSLNPSYNEQFISFQGLAPASFFENNEVELFRTLASYENVLETSAFLMGFHEIFGSSSQTNSQCSEGSILSSVCENIQNLINSEYYNETMMPVIRAHTPAGASIRQVSHYGQVIRFNSFRRYNYNTITNILNYGSSSPPVYQLQLITVPTYLYYGYSDKEVNHNDLYKLAISLPNVVNVHRAERETFNHYDFLWAMDAPEMVYDALLKSMKEAENRALFKN